MTNELRPIINSRPAPRGNVLARTGLVLLGILIGIVLAGVTAIAVLARWAL